MRQAQCGIAGDRALSIQDSGGTIGWHLELARQLCGTQVEFLEFFGKVFAGLNHPGSALLTCYIKDSVPKRRDGVESLGSFE
jgi:hypothetical protein